MELKMLSLPQAADYLKAGLSLVRLDQLAQAMSDTECAQNMSDAKVKLPRKCKIESQFPPDRFFCNAGKRAVEMTGPGKPWKTKNRFSTVSTAPWKSRPRGGISTFPQPGCAPRGRVENQNQVSHSPARGLRRRRGYLIIQT